MQSDYNEGGLCPVVRSLCLTALSWVKVVSKMAGNYFTLEEANGLVPWLDSVLNQALSVREELAGLQEQILRLLRESRRNGHTSREKEIAETHSAMEKAQRELERLVQDVTDRGIIVRDLGQGLVDFPALRDGQEVYLCWRLGEDRVRHWHEKDVGFLGRQPL